MPLRYWMPQGPMVAFEQKVAPKMWMAFCRGGQKDLGSLLIIGPFLDLLIDDAKGEVYHHYQ